MWSRLLTFCSALSLLACVAAGAMWVRSHRTSDQIIWTNEGGRWSARSVQGQVVVGVLLADYYEGRSAEYGWKYERGVPWPAKMELMTVMMLCYDRTARTIYWESSGFGWSQRSSSRDLIATAVAPFWSVTAATGAMPLGWAGVLVLKQVRTRRRKRGGLCSACGYDLRATQDRCPECGARAR